MGCGGTLWHLVVGVIREQPEQTTENKPLNCSSPFIVSYSVLALNSFPAFPSKDTVSCKMR